MLVDLDCVGAVPRVVQLNGIVVLAVDLGTFHADSHSGWTNSHSHQQYI